MDNFEFLLENHVLQHKKFEKYLDGKEKGCNFALAFENDAAQRRGRRESEKNETSGLKVKCC